MVRKQIPERVWNDVKANYEPQPLMITYDEVPEGTPTMRAGTDCMSSFARVHTSVIVKYLMSNITW